MKYSKNFSKTSKSVSHDNDSANAKYLSQGGFIHQESAGIYTYLPLGLKVLRKIENIIREEMENIDALEILMPALHQKDNWIKTGRWDTLDVLFKLKGASSKEYALGASHEEIVTPLAKDYVFSYKDLPFSVFQIQNKFRNEARAKSGILRGREFGMKDLYSFHAEQSDLDEYYKKVQKAYFNIFKKIGFPEDKIYLTYASGGSFSKYSHEYQAVSSVGEDLIYCCEKCKIAINREIIKDQNTCPVCGNKDLIEKKAIEIGNIFKLANKFSSAFKFKYTNAEGKMNDVLMACYGIGPTRIMGSIVELFNDENGILWPKNISPYQIHLVSLLDEKNEDYKGKAEELYNNLQSAGISVLYDDRQERAGVKFKDADLIGIPIRIVISSKTLELKSVEFKLRNQENAEIIKIDELENKIKNFYK